MNLQEVENTFKGENLDMLVFKAYYRTKMCPYPKSCIYGDVCYNAHSKEELRVPLCINFYKKNLCNFKNCDYSHDTKIIELPKVLYSNLREKVGRRIESVESRKRKHNLENEIDHLTNDLKKHIKYENEAYKQIHILQDENSNLLMQLQLKDALINSYTNKIKQVEDQLFAYQQYVQNILIASNSFNNISMSNKQIPILSPIIPIDEYKSNVLYYDAKRDPRLLPK